MASAHASKTSRPSKTRPTPSRTATSTTDASDTIVVETPERPPQLPTPSESTTDVSSQGTDMPSIKNVPKGRGKRVSRSHAKDQSEDCLPESAEEGQAKDRAVSGGDTCEQRDLQSIQHNGKEHQFAQSPMGNERGLRHRQ